MFAESTPALATMNGWRMRSGGSVRFRNASPERISTMQSRCWCSSDPYDSTVESSDENVEPMRIAALNATTELEQAIAAKDAALAKKAEAEATMMELELELAIREEEDE